MKNFLPISFKKAALAAGLLLVFVGEVFSFQSSYVAITDSKLWFEGSSNVNEFECSATNYTGEATLPGYEDPSSLLNMNSGLLSVKVEIEVDSIDCGKSKMNSDLREALKADTFPEITFLFEEAEILSEPQSVDDAFEVRVHGQLTVAGNTRDISFTSEAYYQNRRRVRATGQTTIKMTDYGVEPPTALMGLIRADEELTVNFDLIATPRNE